MRSPVASPVGAAPDTQLNWPLPFVRSSCPLPPSPSGSTQVTEALLILSGALNASDFEVPASLNTNLLAVAPVVRIVISPVMVAGPAARVPVVSITVESVMREEPPIVPALMMGLVRVLFNRVWLASAVNTVPWVGKVAVDATPIPPRPVGKMPVTAADSDKSTAPKTGEPLFDGTVNTWNLVPALVE